MLIKLVWGMIASSGTEGDLPASVSCQVSPSALVSTVTCADCRAVKPPFPVTEGFEHLILRLICAFSALTRGQLTDLRCD